MKLKKLIVASTKEIKVKHKDIGIITIALIFATIMIYITGGTQKATAQLMYIPIIYSAFQFNKSGGIIVGIIAGLLLGPWMPLDIQAQVMQTPQNWITRIIVFTMVGGLTGYLFGSCSKQLITNNLILSNVSDGICVLDTEGRVQYCNTKFEEYIQDIEPSFLHKYPKVEGTMIQTLVTQLEDRHPLRTIQKAVLDGAELKNFLIDVTISGQKVMVQHDISPLIHQHLHIGSIITIKDYTHKQSYEKNLNILRYTDNLTGLKNRRYMEEYAASLTTDSLPQGYLIVDINSLKFINDTFGHTKGDELILQTSYIISNAVRKRGPVSRLDGDEFIVLISNATPELLDQIIYKIQKEMKHFTINNLEMTASCGYYIREDIYTTIEESISLAETNMYLEKNTRNNPLKNNSVNVIMNTLHEKDEYSEHHSTSVSHIARQLAIKCGLPRNEVTEIWNAALLHDIGKIIVPNDIINKPDSLTDSEFAKMKQHSEIGYRLLAQMTGMDKISTIVLSHHERWDGSGYPNGIKQTDIPLGSRIIAIADTFDAITTTRPYREKRTKEEAIEVIQTCSGSQFDPTIVNVFAENFEEITYKKD